MNDSKMEYTYTWLEREGEAICALLGAVVFGFAGGALAVSALLGALA